MSNAHKANKNADLLEKHGSPEAKARNDELPAKLDVKIGTKKESLWSGVLKNAKIMLEQAEDSVAIQTEIIKLAEEKIAEEKEKI